MASPVLAAVDFSEAGRAAFRHALAHSQARQAPLLAIHAVPGDEPYRWHGRERGRLFAELRRATNLAGVPFQFEVQHGDPASVILLHAQAREAQLIVLGTQPRTWLDRLRVRSVAQQVLQAATRPVLVVPANGLRPVAGPALERVVAAVDFGHASDRALDEALSLACADDGRVTMVHVLPATGPVEPSAAEPRLGMLEYQDVLLRRDAWRRMQNILAARPCVAAHLHPLVASGQPAKELARIAQDLDADLITVGVTARGPIGRRLFGATAARLVRAAGRPVLAVPERAPRGDVQPLACGRARAAA